jgi:hypothetical protein
LIVAIICLVIILAVIGMNIYIVIKLNKINSTASKTANSILDLAEFRDLDPYLKDAYKRYIVNILSSAFMKGINKTASDNDVKNYLATNQKELDEMAYAIAKELNTNGFASVEELYKHEQAAASSHS